MDLFVAYWKSGVHVYCWIADVLSILMLNDCSKFLMIY